MTKTPTFNSVTNSDANASEINAAIQSVADQFENVVFRNGETPNTMNADLDMNSNDVLNAGAVNAARMTLAGVNVTTATPLNTSDLVLAKEYDTLASLQADTQSFTTGEYVHVLETDRYFEAALSGATDHDYVNSATTPVKWYDLQRRDVKAAATDLAGPVDLRNYGTLVENSTDIGPIVQIALDDLQGARALYIPPGVWIWDTKVTVDPTDYPMADTVWYRGPKIIGAGPDTYIKTDIDNDYVLEIATAWTGSVTQSRDVVIKDMCFESLSGTTPKCIRVMGINFFELSNLYIYSYVESITFDADVAGDYQTSSNGVVSNCRLHQTSNGKAIYCNASATGAVTISYVDFLNNSVIGGDSAVVLQGAIQVLIKGGDYTAQDSENILMLLTSGAENRCIRIEQVELGNNTTANVDLIRSLSWQGGGTYMNRAVRNSSEEGRSYIYLQSGGGTFRNLEFKQDQLIVENAAKAFVAFQSDVGTVTEGVNIVDPQYVVFAPTASRITYPADFAPESLALAASSGTYNVPVQDEYKFKVNVNAGGSTNVTMTGSPWGGKRILLAISNSSGGAASITVTPAEGDTTPTIGNGETGYAELLYDAEISKWIILAPFVVV